MMEIPKMKFGHCIDCSHLSTDHSRCELRHWDNGRDIGDLPLKLSGCCNYESREHHDNV